MSIYTIMNQTLPTYQTDLKYTTEVVNKLINYGINCPLTRCRKLNVLGFENDHVYCNLNKLGRDDRLYSFQSLYVRSPCPCD